MSDERPERLEQIETALALSDERPERLEQIETALARIEAALAGVVDIEAALAGVATNVDITALGRQLRDEQRVMGAILLRLDHMWPDLIEQLRAMMQQQIGIIDRLRALEEPPQ